MMVIIEPITITTISTTITIKILNSWVWLAV